MKKNTDSLFTSEDFNETPAFMTMSSSDFKEIPKVQCSSKLPVELMDELNNFLAEQDIAKNVFTADAIRLHLNRLKGHKDEGEITCETLQSYYNQKPTDNNSKTEVKVKSKKKKRAKSTKAYIAATIAAETALMQARLYKKLGFLEED